MKKILIADDHQVIRAGISWILESEIENVKIDFADDYFLTKELISNNTFDLLILDLDMPGSIYKNMIKELRIIQKTLKILIFSVYDENIGVQYIMEGANGYLSKNSSEKEIIIAVKSILDYDYYYSPQLMSKLGKQINSANPVSKLSERELEIFNLLVEGNGNLEISNLLNIKMSTISTYKKRIFEKLNVKTIVDLLKIHKEMH